MRAPDTLAWPWEVDAAWKINRESSSAVPRTRSASLVILIGNGGWKGEWMTEQLISIPVPPQPQYRSMVYNPRLDFSLVMHIFLTLKVWL